MSEKKFDMPQVVPIENLPPEIQQMFFNLVAYTINSGKIATIIDGKDLQHEGLHLGNWELRVAKVD